MRVTNMAYNFSRRRASNHRKHLVGRIRHPTGGDPGFLASCAARATRLWFSTCLLGLLALWTSATIPVFAQDASDAAGGAATVIPMDPVGGGRSEFPLKSFTPSLPDEIESPTLVYSRRGEVHLLVTRPESFNTYGSSYEGCRVMMDDGKGGPLDKEIYLGHCDQQLSVTDLLPAVYYRFQTFAVLDAATHRFGPGSNLVAFLTASVPLWAGYDEVTGEATVPDEAPWYFAEDKMPLKQKPKLMKMGARDLRIQWPMPADLGGTAIMGFAVVEQVEFPLDPANPQGTMNSTSPWRVVYNGTATPDVFHLDRKGLDLNSLYRYRVFAINKAGTSRPIAGSIRLFDLLQTPSSYAVALPQTVESGVEFDVRLQAMINGAKEGGETRLYVLSVQNVCEKDKTGVLCLRVTDSHPLYRESDLLARPLCCIDGSARGDGIYDFSLTLRTQGVYSIIVQTLEVGGLFGQYWDNQWFYGQPSGERHEALIDYDFGEQALVSNAADFVSVRWSGYLLPEHSEEYTFFALVDDTARVSVNEVLLFDKWTQAKSSDELAGRIFLEAGKYVPIVFEYKELDGNATVKLRYSSFSTPKQVIPPDRLFRASFVDGFPAYVSVTQGKTSGAVSQAYGLGLKFTTAGEENRFYIQAKDAAGNNILTEKDVFNVKFVLRQAAGNSQKPYEVARSSLPVNQTAADGLYVVFYKLDIAGQYHVFISVDNDEPLGGSPFPLVSSFGVLSAAHTVASGTGIKEFVVNEEGSFQVHVRDKTSNAIDDAFLHVSASLQWLEPVAWSPGFNAANDQDLLEAEFGSRFVGVAKYDDKTQTYRITYRAFREGLYDMAVWLSGKPIEGSPFRVRGYTSTSVLPSGSSFELPFGEKCRLEIGEPPSSWTVGNELKFLVQLRDMFGNVLTSPVPDVFAPRIRATSQPAIANLFDEAVCSTYRGCSSPSGLETCDTYRGVYECALVPKSISSAHVISVTVNGTEVSRVEKVTLLNKTTTTQGPFPIVLTPGGISPQNSKFDSVPGTCEAGVERRIRLQWRDVYGNAVPNVPPMLFEAKMDGNALNVEDNKDGTYSVDVRAEKATRKA
eukprot:g13320.t1